MTIVVLRQPVDLTAAKKADNLVAIGLDANMTSEDAAKPLLFSIEVFTLRLGAVQKTFR